MGATRILLANRNDIEIDWNRALSFSWEFGSEDKLLSLFSRFGGHFSDDHHAQAFKSACTLGYLKVVKFLLQKQIDPNIHWQGEFGGEDTPLPAASHHGHFEIVHLLVENGAAMHTQGASYGSPLYAASGEGHLEIVQFLVKAGAGGWLGWECGKYGSALHAASANGHVKIARYLLANGANPHEGGLGHGSVLELAERHGHLDVVELLLSSGASLNKESGRDILSRACIDGRLGLVKLLLSRGVVPDSNTEVLQTAASKGHLEIVKILLANGVDPNKLGRPYGSPLAAAHKHPEIFELLLEHGAVP
jgi:ankyrin repeat protein